MRPLLLLVLTVALGLPPTAEAWSWPVEGPVTRPFALGGDPYAAGQHRGIDIGAAEGTAVRAPTAGAVSFAGSVPGGGIALTIQTSGGLSVTLLHLGTRVVSRGAAVEEGAVVGRIGASGAVESGSAHVHLGVRVTADPRGYLDPLGFLPVVTGEPPAEPLRAPAPAVPVQPGVVVTPPAPVAEPGPVAPAPVPAPAPVAVAGTNPVTPAATPSPAAAAGAPPIQGVDPVVAAPPSRAAEARPAAEPPPPVVDVSTRDSPRVAAAASGRVRPAMPAPRERQARYSDPFVSAPALTAQGGGEPGASHVPGAKRSERASESARPAGPWAVSVVSPRPVPPTSGRNGSVPSVDAAGEQVAESADGRSGGEPRLPLLAALLFAGAYVLRAFLAGGHRLRDGLDPCPLGGSQRLRAGRRFAARWACERRTLEDELAELVERSQVSAARSQPPRTTGARSKRKEELVV